MTIQGQAFRAASDTAALPAEIAFLTRHGVPMPILRHAAAAARQTGCSADEALVRLDLLGENAFYRALAAELGLPFLPDEPPLAAEARFPYSAVLGLAPLDPRHGGGRLVLAPTGERVAWLLAAHRPFGTGLAITTPSALTRAVLRSQAAAVARAAANRLADAQPHRSYRDGITRAQRLVMLVACSVLIAAGILAPELALSTVGLFSTLIFFGMVAVRLGAVHEPIPVRPARPMRREADRDLPVYTLIAALRREGRVLARLVRSLSALDYPPTKLQVMLVVEADDAEMAAALAETALPGHFEVIVVPPGEPRTKPRALNVALPLARGAFVAVYDAEDVPDPDQLRLAVATFRDAPPQVACVQARLVIDNTADNWLTRLFTIEYATLFDVINPGLAANELPVPLGGTSNHFRTQVLQELHGWDAWNVTEDADLGLRLALAGYRVQDLPSSTLEEAPASWKPWFGQRIRWMKGFMQVVTTHSRHPLATLRALGFLPFFATVTMTLGTVASALGYPIFTLLTLLAIIDGGWLDAGTTLAAIKAGVGLTLFGTGLVAMLAPAVVALKRRGWWRLLVYVPLLPFYYGLISIAAWQALIEFARHPCRWHKTEHGLARTSRSGFLTDAAAAPAPPRRAGGSG